MGVRWMDQVRERPEWVMMAIGMFIILAVLTLGIAVSGEEDDSPHPAPAAGTPAEH